MKGLQAILKLYQRLRTKITAVERKLAERPQVDGARPGPTHVQFGEVQTPVGIAGHDLAIPPCIPARGCAFTLCTQPSHRHFLGAGRYDSELGHAACVSVSVLTVGRMRYGRLSVEPATAALHGATAHLVTTGALQLSAARVARSLRRACRDIAFGPATGAVHSRVSRA